MFSSSRDVHLIHFSHVFDALALLLKQLLEDAVQLEVGRRGHVVVQLNRNIN